MRHWEKILKRASLKDKMRIGHVVLLIEAHHFPPDTIRLRELASFRTRVGDWRIEFHYVDGIVIIDTVKRRNENTYKR